MSKWFPKVISYFSLIAGLLIIALQLIDLLGVADLPFLEKRIPSLTLLVGGMILAYLGVEYHTMLKAIHDAIESHQVESLSILYNRLDPNLAEVFGEEVRGKIDAIQKAITHKRITIYDQDRFAGYYKKLLRLYANATFHATGLPYKRYFWNEANQQMIGDFIKNGGKFLRIFYCTREDLQNDAVKAIIEAQCKMGVVVYTCDQDRVAPQLRTGHYYIVETQKRIGWILTVDPSHRITEITATANQADLAHYLKLIDEIKDSDATQRYYCEADEPA